MGDKKRLERRKRGRVQAVVSSDLGTPEHAAQLPSVIALTQTNQRRRMVYVQDPLDYYKDLKKGGINHRQWEAGRKLEELFQAAGLLRSVVPLLGTIRIPSHTAERERSKGQWAHYQEFWEAVDHLGGRDSIAAKLCINIACFGYLLRDINVDYYGNSNAKMARLCEALEHLADHLQIPLYPVRGK